MRTLSHTRRGWRVLANAYTCEDRFGNQKQSKIAHAEVDLRNPFLLRLI